MQNNKNNTNYSRQKKKYILKINNLVTGYRNKKECKAVTEDFSIEIPEGELVFIIGPNGCGKSTLLKTISGLLPPLSGSILIENSDISKIPKRELAKKISVTLTHTPDPGLFTSFDIVSMGRAPYTDWKHHLSDNDIKIIESAMKTTGADKFSTLPFSRLSDGEKQKVITARALAQDTQILCMDEPSSYLDLPSKAELAASLASIKKMRNKTLFVTTHDLDTALGFADRLWVISRNGEIVSGLPEDLALDGTVSRVFSSGDNFFNPDTGHYEVLDINPDNNPDIKKSHTDLLPEITISGSSTALLWTCKSLKKNNISYSISDNFISDNLIRGSSLNILIIEKDKHKIEFHAEKNIFYSIEQLVEWIKSSQH